MSPRQLLAGALALCAPVTACMDDSTKPNPGLRPQWSISLSTESGGWRGTPVADSAQLVVMRRSDQVMALRSSDGGALWTATLPPPWASSYADKLVMNAAHVIVASGSSLAVLNRQNGQLLWNTTLTEPDNFSSVTATGGSLFVSSGRLIRRFDEATGSLAWARPYPVDSNAVRLTGVQVSGDTAYVVGTRFTPDGVFTQALLIALQTADGRELWRRELPVSEGGYFLGAPTVSDRWLIASDYGVGGVQAFDRFTGARQWRTKGLPCCVGTSWPATVLDGRVYYTGGDETARALDLETGRELWRTQVQGSFSSEQVVCGRTLFGNSLAINKFDLGTGRLLGRTFDDEVEYGTSGFATARGLAFVTTNRNVHAFACD